MKKNFSLFLLLVAWMILVIGAFALPAFGSFPYRSPDVESVATYYIANGLSHTGALNLVTTIVWDYRAYDTIGEVTILFTAVCGVMAILRKSGDV